MSDSAPECDDFAKVVGGFVENMAKIKALQRELKEVRQKQQELQKIIIGYMENKSLDICRINKDGESGQLAVRKSKSTKGVKRDSAVAEIAVFFEENSVEFQQGNVSTKADELWGRVQQTREVQQKKSLALS